MLRRAKTLKGYKLDSLDGEIGHVEEFYFDDQHWAIRYLIANTGNWLTGRQVLISPYSISAVIEEGQHFAVNLTKKQIEDSPSLSTDKPVSKQFEQEYSGYYTLPMYWGGPYMRPFYTDLASDREQWRQSTQGEKSWNPHLRSTHEVSHYHIHASDGDIGHVDDFIIDDQTWAICYLVIDTKNWWPGKKILISPQWIERISWSDSKLFLSLSTDVIKQSPEYTEASLLTRDYEARLNRHYHRQGSWVDEPAVPEHSKMMRSKR